MPAQDLQRFLAFVNPAKPTKVNRNLATRLHKVIEEAQNLDGKPNSDCSEDEEARRVPLASDKKKKVAAATASALLADDRFSGLFNEPDFEVDEESFEYKLLHPVDAPK